MKFYKFILLVIIVVLSACSSYPKYINDIKLYPQNTTYYLQDSSLNDTLANQKKLVKESLEKFYAPWSPNMETDSLEINKLYEYYSKKVTSLKTWAGYAENSLVRDTSLYEELNEQSELNGKFNTMVKGISIQRSNIRSNPTDKPYFLNFEKAGEGYPFDYWQKSTLPVGTPIFIYHEANGWSLITCHICSGWVKTVDIAYIEDDLINQIKSRNKIAIWQDDIPIYDSNVSYICTVDIGTILPLTKTDSLESEVLLFRKNKYGFASPTLGSISNNSVKDYPVKFSENNIAELSEKMMNQNYGWGGMYFNRDCSQSMLDLFMPFGILLPRNSSAQAKHGGRFVSMKDIEKREYKTFIIENAIPFKTLVRVPGHIMLYIGHIGSEPLVLHNIWGLRTKSFWGDEGRFIIGKTVITSLEPGLNVPDLADKKRLLNRIEGITLLGRK